MKCITLTQPWASLILDGKKKIETRSWKTCYRGPLGIHAGMKIDAESRDACIRFHYDTKTIIRGAILCTCTLLDCVQFPNLLIKIDPYGDFRAGRWGWILKDIKPLQWPVPAKGALSLWDFELPGE